MRESYIENAYVLIFSPGSSTGHVEPILQIPDNGIGDSPTLVLQQKSPAAGDLVYVICNVSYQGTDPDNYSDVTRDNIDEKFPLSVSENLDFSTTGLPMMGRILSWPASESGSQVCQMRFAVAKWEINGSRLGNEEKISFTVHNYAKRGNISYPISGTEMNAINSTDPNLYVKESKEFVVYEAGEGRIVNFYLFEYPAATSGLGHAVSDTEFSRDRPYILLKRVFNSGEIRYSRLDLYEGETRKFLNIYRNYYYRASYSAQGFGYDTKEEAMANTSNVWFDWEVSDDWGSVFRDGQFAILTNKSEIYFKPGINFDFEFSMPDKLDASRVTRKILLNGPILQKSNVEITCTDKNSNTSIPLTDIEGGYELPADAVSKPLTLHIKLHRHLEFPEGPAFNGFIFQLGGLRREVPVYAPQVANCYLAVGGGEDIDIWLGRANYGKQRILSTDAVTAEVLWKDNPNLQVECTCANGIMTVKSLSSPDEVGNMVIAAKVGGKIRWSWHLWYPGAEVVTYNPQKSMYEYKSIYTKTFGGQTWMDRNLGALANYYGDKDTKGVYYQWERKDPFPNSILTVQHINTKKVFDAQGNEILDFNYVATQTDSPDVNLENSIENPHIRYRSSSGRPYDWWAPSGSSFRSGYWETAYSPCPLGWKVAKYTSVLESHIYNPDIVGYFNSNYGYFPEGYFWGEGRIDGYHLGVYVISEEAYIAWIFRTNDIPVRCVRE